MIFFFRYCGAKYFYRTYLYTECDYSCNNCAKATGF